MNFVSTFVEQLAQIRLDNVFNPYRDRCTLHDSIGAEAIRRRNLKIYLRAVEDMDLRCIWVGRDLGYRGGRRTGLALTDEPSLAIFANTFGGVCVKKATVGPPVAERTAAEVWKVVPRLTSPPFLWNVFPFHPFSPGDPMSNRTHTARERDLAVDILASILGWLKPHRAIALGRDAVPILERFGCKPIYVRHPSYGGKADFLRGIRNLYPLK